MVSVPYYLFKVVYFPNENECESFLIPNTQEGNDSDLTHYQVKTQALETMTNLDFKWCETKNNKKLH
jgi:DNA/RNA endonuclease G (NUC1)